MQAQANAEIGNFLLTRALRRQYFAFDASLAETTRDDDAVHPAQGVRSVTLYVLRLEVVNVDLGARVDATVQLGLRIIPAQWVLPALFLLPFLPFVGPLPEPNGWPLLGGAAFAAIGIWWFMTLAYARAKAQTLAPFEYTGLIWSSLLGYVLFHEIPSLRLYAGAGIIILACLVVAFETHFTARREARAAAAEIAP